MSTFTTHCRLNLSQSERSSAPTFLQNLDFKVSSLLCSPFSCPLTCIGWKSYFFPRNQQPYVTPRLFPLGVTFLGQAPTSFPSLGIFFLPLVRALHSEKHTLLELSHYTEECRAPTVSSCSPALRRQVSMPQECANLNSAYPPNLMKEELEDVSL